MLYIDQDGRGNSFELPDNSWYWSYYGSDYLYAITFHVVEDGYVYIEYNQLIGSYPEFEQGYNRLPIYPNIPLQIQTSRIGSGGYIILPDPNTIIYNLTIRFVPGELTTTSSTTTTLYPVPENPEIFLHVGNISVSGESCGSYKYTLTGTDANYFSLYGQRIYLTKYPHTPKTYTVNVCAKDLANRFTPVCDTFSLDVKECVFTTEPPTTTPAPNFGFVQQENTVTPVNQYTYNKIYSVRKHK